MRGDRLHDHRRGARLVPVDLAGGTLDIWPLGLLHAGSRTVNLAIDIAAEVTVTARASAYLVRQNDSEVEERTLAGLAAQPEGALVARVLEALQVPPVEVTLATGSPRGGGLGGSSALAVALIAAAEELRGDAPSTPAHRAALARDLEARLMSLPTGVQDHYPALLGGVLEIGYRPGGEVVRTLDVDLDALGRCLIVAYTGSSHFSAGANWSVVRRRLDGEPVMVGLFSRICEAAAEVAGALGEGDLATVGAAMSREWSARRELSPEVSTPQIEQMLSEAIRLGAWGGKACGAGGGGSVALLCPPERRAAVEERMTELGAELLSARPALGGVSVRAT